MISCEKPRKEILQDIASTIHFGQPSLLEKVYRALSLLEDLRSIPQFAKAPLATIPLGLEYIFQWQYTIFYETIGVARYCGTSERGG